MARKPVEKTDAFVRGEASHAGWFLIDDWMNFLPRQTRTIVLPHPAHRVMAGIRRLVRTPQTSAEAPAEWLFNGVVSSRSFSVSRRIHAYQNFLPVMNGRLEDTSLGSILFVRYRMFGSSLGFLIFSSLLIMVVGLFFLIMDSNLPYFLFSLALLTINYIVAIAGFNRQVSISQRLLEGALNRFL